MARMDQQSYFNRTNNQPAWAAEALGHKTLIPGGARLDTTTFAGLVEQTVTIDDGAGYSADDTDLTIDAFTGTKIKPGDFLEYAANPGTFTRAASLLLPGGTALVVDPLPAALADNDVLNLVADPKVIQAGYVVGRTFAERDADTPFHKALDTDEEFYLIAFDVIPQFGDEIEDEYDVTLVRHQTLIRENMLPSFAVESATVQAALQAAYQMTVGAP